MSIKLCCRSLSACEGGDPLHLLRQRPWRLPWLGPKLLHRGSSFHHSGLRLSALGNRILLRSWRKNLSYCTEEDDEGGLSNYLRHRKGAAVESLVLNRVAENLDDQLCVRNWAGQKPGCSFRCRFSLVTLPRLRG